MSPACTELFESYEQYAERLRRAYEAFTWRVCELECARKYGNAYRIEEALGLLKTAAGIYMQDLTEHVEHVATYVACELRDQAL